MKLRQMVRWVGVGGYWAGKVAGRWAQVPQVGRELSLQAEVESGPMECGMYYFASNYALECYIAGLWLDSHGSGGINTASKQVCR